MTSKEREPEVPKMMIPSRLPHHHFAQLLVLTLLLQELLAVEPELLQEDLLSLEKDKMTPTKEPEVPKMMIPNRLPHQPFVPPPVLIPLLQVLPAREPELPQED